MLPTLKPSVAPSPSPTGEPTVGTSTPRPSNSPSASPTVSPTVVDADDGFQITLSEIEFFVAAIFCLCGVLMFVAFRYFKLMKVTKETSGTDERMINFFNADHAAEEKQKVELNNDHIQSDAIKVTQRNVWTNGEYNKDGDVRFALDKVASDNLGDCSTPGNIEIGPQESSL